LPSVAAPSLSARMKAVFGSGFGASTFATVVLLAWCFAACFVFFAASAPVGKAMATASTAASASASSSFPKFESYQAALSS
jgi:hypothetical protein